jgi:cyclopropane fatty-acyl-phospholipid synthase-like methyltransferase
MKPETTEGIVDLMDSTIISAALGSAMELGLFWLLAKEPLSASDVARSLNIPLNRCHHWLQILCKLGLLENKPEGCAPSSLAREAILDAQTQETWAFHACEARDSALFVQDLALNIGKPMSTWRRRTSTPPDYFQRIQEDPNYAAGLTRKLYEIHTPLAEQLADMLDLQGVKSLLDLGGGSGVVSFALLRKQHDLTSVVMDVENVCQVGQGIASENELEERITYLAADFLQDDLPTGFDMVMLCDVGSFSESLFRRIYYALNPKGQLVIVDKFAPSRTSAPPSRLPSVFLDSLVSPAPSIDFTTAEVVQTRLQQVGFGDFSLTSVPHKDHLPWNIDWMMLQARKQTNEV